MDRNISRRTALRRGAMVGGALWVVPTVQVIGLSPASAQQVSGPSATTPSSVIIDPSGSPVEGPSAGQPGNAGQPASARPATAVAGDPDYAG
jgi:hypothetical protein